MECVPQIQNMDSPQLLSGSVILSKGDTASLNINLMTSRSSRWLRVEEISFCLYATPFPDGEGPQANLGELVEFEGKFLDFKLTSDFVPVWLVGPRIHQCAEYEEDGSIGGIKVGLNNVGPFETYRWKLPKPVYLPPGAAINLTFRRKATAKNTFPVDGTGKIYVECAVRATQLAASASLPKENCIPFITAFTPETFPALTSGLDLSNVFTSDFYAQRLTSRVALNNAQNNEKTGTDFKNEVVITMSNNLVEVCDEARLHSVFPASQMAWTYTRIMAPRDYLKVKFQVAPSSVAQPQIALIGYRKESL